MAMKKTNSEAGKALKYYSNPADKTEYPKEQLTKKFHNNNNNKTELLHPPAYYCFKPKPGGLIPAKRRSVKRMIFDDIVRFFGSLLSGPNTHSSTSAETHKAAAKTSNTINISTNQVYPSPP